MTLILTEITGDGIIMVADKAITIVTQVQGDEFHSRSFSGLNKIIYLDGHKIGASFWGWSNVEPFQKINGIFFDTWLKLALKRCTYGIWTLRTLAMSLENELRQVIPEMTDEELEICPFGNGGVHLCGLDHYNENSTPSFWHIHNGKSKARPEQDINPKIVNAINEFPPSQFGSMALQDRSFLAHNGEIGPYSLFLTKFSEFINNLITEEHIFPNHTSLISRGQFWKAQVQFISEIYGLSTFWSNQGFESLPRSISKDVSVLTIGIYEGPHFEQ